jgi:hypothetical protein
MNDPITPPCLSDEPVPAAVREADAMLGMWAEMFRQQRIAYGAEGALERMDPMLDIMPADDVRNLLRAAVIRLTEPTS